LDPAFVKQFIDLGSFAVLAALILLTFFVAVPKIVKEFEDMREAYSQSLAEIRDQHIEEMKEARKAFAEILESQRRVFAETLEAQRREITSLADRISAMRDAILFTKDRDKK